MQAYVTTLALAAVLLPHHSALLSHHLSLILLLTWGVYVYRDVVPLATTTLRPADADEGVFIWLKLLILTEAAVLLPIVTPRATARGLAEGPNVEQKAGWYSRRMFSWLNETVAKAHRVEHIPLDDLPTLANSDSTRNLVENSLKVCLFYTLS